MPAAGGLTQKRFVVDALRDVLVRTPGAGERGVHLCYGDYKHRHFTIPADLSLCVELANAISDSADFVHMPADRETGRDPGYYEPLRDLSARRLALGVIDYEGDEERTNELVQAAVSGPSAPSLERLLGLHATTSAPIR
jgi:hypothetical protein